MVLDTVGTDLGARRRLPASGGRMTTVAFDLDGHCGHGPTSPAFERRLVRCFSEDPRRDRFEELTHRVEAGELRPLVGPGVPALRGGRCALGVGRGRMRGKIVVDTTA